MTTVRDDIAKHHARFAPEYGGYLSDHGPMSALALLGLGAPEERVSRYLRAYQQHLRPLAGGSAYDRLLTYYLAEVARNGIAGTLRSHLPDLISGWVREAYHPLIRLGYGVEFDVPGEVAAGLAYLHSAGADPRMAALAGAAHQTVAAPEAIFTEAGTWPPPVLTPARPEATFTERAQAVIDNDEFARAAVVFTDNLRRVSRVALAVFAATHNFFALHLVTGGHAFRLVAPYAGPHADALFNLGVVAGYAAVGAPPFHTAPLTGPALSDPDPTTQNALTPSVLLALCRDDEHDYKLAYSAWRQAAHWHDPAYLDVARAYLKRFS